MKKLLFMLLAALYFCAGPLQGQDFVRGNLTAASTDCADTTLCVILNLPSGSGSAKIVLGGTFVGTLQFEATVGPTADDTVNWSSINGDPLTTGVAVSSSTASGTWGFNVSGLQRIRVRPSAYTSGTIRVRINASSAAADSRGGGGTGAVVHNIRFCEGFAGADAGARITACIANLPATGGTADARGLEGAQACTANITFDKSVALLLGDTTLTMTACSFIIDSAGVGSSIEGTNSSGLNTDKGTRLIAGSGVNLIEIGTTSAVAHVRIENIGFDGNNVAGARGIITGTGTPTTNQLDFRNLRFDRFPAGAMRLIATQDSRFYKVHGAQNGAIAGNVASIYLAGLAGIQAGANVFTGVAMELAPYAAFYLDVDSDRNIFQGTKFDNAGAGTSGFGFYIVSADNVFTSTIAQITNNDAFRFEGTGASRNQVIGASIAFGGAATSGNLINMNTSGAGGRNSVDGLYVSLLPVGTTGIRDVGAVENWYSNVFFPAGGTALSITNPKATVLRNSVGLLEARNSGRFTGTATFVLTGSIDPTASTAVVGVGTLFDTELVVGDRITVSAETRTVTAITNALNLTVDTAFTDTANDTSPDKLAAIFIVRDSSGVPRMIVNDLGNVGMGDSAPSTRLSIGGTGSANGITLGDDAADPVNLYRNSANILRTDDALSLASTLHFTGAAGAAPTAEGTFNFDTTDDRPCWGNGASTDCAPKESEVLQATAGTGFVRSSGVAFTLAELSGGCVTSGSNATVCIPATTAAQTGTYQILAADFPAAGCGYIPVTSGTFTMTLVASGSQPANGRCVTILNYGTGVVTLARSGQNINGAAANLTGTAGSATAPTGWQCVSDGTNYICEVMGAAGAPTDAQYVTLATNATLTAERVLTQGTGVSVTDAGAGSTVTVANTGHVRLFDKRGTTILPSAAFGGGLTNLGDTPTGTVGTASSIAPDASDGLATDYATAATLNDNAGAVGQAGIYRVGRNMDMQFTASQEQTTVIRFWIALTDQSIGTMLAADDPAGNYAGFQYCNDGAGVACAADRTNWFACTKDNTTQGCTDTTVAADGAAHEFQIVDNGANWTFYIDGTLRATRTTNLPLAGTNLGIIWGVRTLEAVAKNFRLYGIDLKIDE